MKKKTNEGIVSTVKKAYQDAKKDKEQNDYYNKLAGDTLKRMEPKELKPYYDAMRDKKKK